MSCPQCRGIEKTFNSGMAERELREYRTHGPAKTTRLLIEAIKALGISGLTLLDIGGGVGAIQHELLKDGVDHATAVDASRAYLAAARQEAERQGQAQRVTYQFGDFVELASQIPRADIVTLERVICCYPDMRALVGLSSAHAGSYYGVVFPRDTWWMRFGGKVIGFFQSLQRNSFRFFVHPTEEIEKVIGANGLKRRYYRQTFFWQVIVYAR
jgi:predicted TPR repeat methyltransferase